MPRPSPSPFPTNRPNFFVEPSTTIESLRNSSTRCEPLASRCSSTPSKDPLVEKEEYHPKCALSSRHSPQAQMCVVRSYLRLRDTLSKDCNSLVQRMQKALTEM